MIGGRIVRGAALGVAVVLAMGQAACAQGGGTGWVMEDWRTLERDPHLILLTSAGGTNFEYKARPGNERSISVFRENCPAVTERLSVDGPAWIKSIWALGTRAETLAAARATISELAAIYDADCPVPAGELNAVLRGFDGAFAGLEDRIEAEPFSDAAAWHTDTGGYHQRRENRVTIQMMPNQPPQPPGLFVRVEGCEGGEESASLDGNWSVDTEIAATSREAFVAEALAALRRTLVQAQRACGLAADVPARLERGFTEAAGTEFDNLRDE